MRKALIVPLLLCLGLSCYSFPEDLQGCRDQGRCFLEDGGVLHGAVLDGGPPADTDAGPQTSDAGPDAGGVPAARGLCSDAGWCWQNPLPQGDDLRAVWAAAPDDLWVATGGGSVLRFRAGAWTAYPLPGSPHEIPDLWGSGPTDVWASGATLMHFDGTGWSAPGDVDMEAKVIRGTGPADVWAFGPDLSFRHWDGGAWGESIRKGSGEHFVTDALVTGSSGFAVTNEGQAFRLEAGAWEPFGPPALRRDGGRVSFESLAMHAGTVWAAGDEGHLARWDGPDAGWVAVREGAPQSGNYEKLVATDAGLWVVDFTTGIHPVVPAGKAEYPSKNLYDRTFTSAVATSDGKLWMVGSAGTVCRRSVDGRWTELTERAGSPWNIVKLVALPDGTAWAVNRENLLRYQDGGWTVAPFRALNGSVPHVELSALWEVGGVLWIGTAEGHLLRYDPTGPTLRIERDGTGLGVFALWGTGPDTLWAAGRYGEISRRHLDGGWEADIGYPESPIHSLLALSGSSDAGQVFAVGDDGWILRRDADGGWVDESLAEPRNYHLRTVHVDSREKVVIGGQGGSLLHRNPDGTWSDESKQGVPEELMGNDINALVGTPEAGLFFVGGQGVFAHRATDDGVWEVRALGLVNPLYSIGMGPQDIWAAGNGGSLLRRAR